MKKKLIFATLIASAFLCTKNVYAFDSNNYKNKSLCGNFEVAGFHSDGGIDPVKCAGSYEEAKNREV